MSGPLLAIVVVATAAIVGSTFFTLRWFRAATRPPVDVKPGRAKSNPHDAATTAQLKHFFEGKVCVAAAADSGAAPRRPTSRATNAKTREEIAWADIPAADLSATLESQRRSARTA
jgi:hypothetical protein